MSRRMEMMSGGAAINPMALHLNAAEGLNQAVVIPFTNSRAMSFRMLDYAVFASRFTLDARDGTNGLAATFIYEGVAYSLECYIDNVLTATGITTNGVKKMVYVQFPSNFTANVTLGASDAGQGFWKELIVEDVRVYSTALSSSERANLWSSPNTLASSIQHRYLFKNNYSDSIGSTPAFAVNNPPFIPIT